MNLQKRNTSETDAILKGFRRSYQRKNICGTAMFKLSDRKSHRAYELTHLLTGPGPRSSFSTIARPFSVVLLCSEVTLVL